jgi:hypothetical protein
MEGLKKKNRTVAGSLKKSSRVVREEDFISNILPSLLEKQTAKYDKLLLCPPKFDSLNAESKKELHKVSEELALRLLHRASLFASHHKPILTIDDLEKAWISIEMDAQK